MYLFVMSIKGGFKYGDKNHEQDAENETKTEAQGNIVQHLNHVELEIVPIRYNPIRNKNYSKR